MIITCPACETRFLVDDAALGGSGRRRLRCANCDNVWTADARLGSEPAGVADPQPRPREPVLVEPAPPAPPPLRIEPRIDRDADPEAVPALGPGVLPRPTGAVAPSQQPGHSVAAIGLILVAGIVIVLVAVFATVAARDSVVAVWDKAKHVLLAQSHVPPPPIPPPSTQAADATADAKLGAGLTVTVVPKRDGDSLVVDGEIVNSAPVPRPVPHLRLTLRDGNKAELVSKVIDPPVGKLAPGATEHFNTVFPHPSIAASKVDVTFATD